MDDAWSWLASLPPPLRDEGRPDTPPPPWFLPLAASTDGASIVLQADTTTPAAAAASPAGDGEHAPLVAFSVAINGAGGDARALWASEPFPASSSPVAPRVQLLAQLLNEVLALSPYTPRLGGAASSDAAKVDLDTISAVVGAAESADPSAAAAFFSLALLLRLFWLCATDAPADAGYLFFRDLGAAIERGLGACRPALAAFLRAAGPDAEARLMRSLGYMLAKWCLLREITAHHAPLRRAAIPAALCVSYAAERHGLWVLRGYAPLLAMRRVVAGNAAASVAAAPHEAPEEPALRYGLVHQQLEAVAQLEYAVRARDRDDRRFLTVSVRVDNVRLRVARLAFRKDDDNEEDDDDAMMHGESHFPSRVRVWVGPRYGASYATGPSLGRSTGNPERDVEVTRTVKGAFAGGGATKPANGGAAPRIKAKMRSSARTRSRSWRWEQEAEGSAGVFEGVLYDPVAGTEVSAWRPAGTGAGSGGATDPRSGMRRRYGGPARAFGRVGGLVVAGDELPEEITWRVGREVEGRTLRWRFGLKVWVSYLPNEVRSRHFETRCVEWAHEVDLPLLAVDGDRS